MEANRALHRPILAVIYAALALLAACWLLRWDTDAGIALFFALLLPLLGLLRWPNSPRLLFLGFAVMVGGKFVYALTQDPLKGPDERNYFAQVAAFQDLGSFFNYAWEQITQNGFNVSAYPIFGLLYMPFYKGVQLEDPLAIIVFNSLLLLLVVHQTYILCRDHFRFPLPALTETKFHGWTAFALFVSPSFMFMSSIFAKDVTSVLLGLLGALLLLRRRYVLFVVVMLYATGLRDYAIVYTLGFYLLFRGRTKTALAMLVGSLGAVFLFAGPSGVLNAGLLAVFLFFSPNPTNVANWDAAVLYRTLEAIWMSFTLVAAAAVYVKAPETRRFYRLAMIVLLTYACTLILVGYVTVVSRDLDYGVGTIGDNMVRKKLPVLPVLYVFSAYTMIWLGKLTRPFRAVKEVRGCGEGTNSAVSSR
ncbi:hypothetical protein [Cohnella sp. REN36]|uniref:hypothetical protein n=1 Tax=Cohnella sp. REN36 TaxID=2887347 RepID=UPI001D158017|nr:hypothetical protein [Cohnella sp. REN36]MCC3375551.1 hypothetical protein [Cohnella sp. REN36]